MSNKHEPPPFYGENIIRESQQDYINSLLEKYKNLPPTDALKKQIYDELQAEKHKGTIKIPFKVVMRQDPSGKFPSYIDVILDTKV